MSNLEAFIILCADLFSERRLGFGLGFMTKTMLLVRLQPLSLLSFNRFICLKSFLTSSNGKWLSVLCCLYCFYRSYTQTSKLHFSGEQKVYDQYSVEARVDVLQNYCSAQHYGMTLFGIHGIFSSRSTVNIPAFLVIKLKPMQLLYTLSHICDTHSVTKHLHTARSEHKPSHSFP